MTVVDTKTGTDINTSGRPRPVLGLADKLILKHSPGETHARHWHRAGFLAVVLDGRYTEIGDTGAWTATSGSVIAHAPSETHHGAISGQSAEVLLLPSRRASATPPNTLDDIDEAIRLSRQSLSEAADFVLEQFKPAELRAFDWPAELAAALREDSTLQINDWTHSRGIDKSVASREFRKVFQYSPSRFRLKSKVHKAVDLLISSEEPLATVAQKSGFSDQAHMCRSLVAMTG